MTPRSISALTAATSAHMPFERGAACVYSYEPHSGSYNSLVKSADTFANRVIVG
jgi:hypothetical protein